MSKLREFFRLRAKPVKVEIETRALLEILAKQQRCIFELMNACHVYVDLLLEAENRKDVPLFGRN
jgi:hypothetical protein